MIGKLPQENLYRFSRPSSPHLRHGISLPIRMNQFILTNEGTPCLRLVAIGDECPAT